MCHEQIASPGKKVLNKYPEAQNLLLSEDKRGVFRTSWSAAGTKAKPESTDTADRKGRPSEGGACC